MSSGHQWLASGAAAHSPSVPAVRGPFSKAWKKRAAEFPSLGRWAIVAVGRAALTGLLLGAGAMARAQTPATADKTTPSESSERLALRASYEAGVKRLAEERARAIRGVLQAAIAKAEAEWQERQRARNVRGIMISRNLKEALEAVLAQYEANGALVWPEDIRRENEEALAAVRAAVEKAAAAADRAETELRAQALERFLELLRPEERLADVAEVEALFDRWIAGEWPAAGPAEKTPDRAAEGSAEAAPPAGEPPTPATPPGPPPPSPPEIFAISDERAGNEALWSVVGQWTAEMAGPDILRIPLPGGPGAEEGRSFNPLMQGETKWQLVRRRAVGADERPHWRLKRVEGREPMDVLEWPRPENRGVLTVRTRPATTFPAKVGFEIQCAPKDAAPSAPAETVAETPDPPTVEVQVATDPPGATIIVDKKIYREGERVARTPARIRVTPENHHIRLRLAGYVDHVVPEFRAQHMRELFGRLTPERDLPGKRVRVNPRRIWEVVEGMRVNAGDRVVVVASGEWKIGEKGEPCGPAGYDRKDPRFRHYYEGSSVPPRQMPEANYGALLFRIGFPGPVFLAAEEAGITARVGGVIMLDVNEGMDKEWRKDNSGTLDVKIIVIQKEQ